MRQIAASLVGAALLPVLSGTAGAVDDENFFTHLHTEKVMANVTVSPGRAGPVEIVIQLETVDEAPLTAKAVSVTLSNAQPGSGRQTVEAIRSGDAQWHVKTSMLTPGRWMLGLGISISDTSRVDIESPILIQ
jgi:copper transport protein